jgi:transcriptional regulator with XRE-family HTH domain
MGGEAVFAISNISKKLLEKLRKKPYRHAYMAEHIRRGIAYQIRALRAARNWNQGVFAKHLGKPQSVVCRLEDPDYGKVTIQTLLEVANVFDVALEIKFSSYSSFVCNTRDLSVGSMQVAGFQDDLGMMGLSPISYHGGQSIIVEAGSMKEISPHAGMLTLNAFGAAVPESSALH